MQEEARHICMVSVQHAAKDDRIYYKQALSLRRAGYRVSVVSSGPDGPVDMGGESFPPGKDERGIDHYFVTRPKDVWSRFQKKVFTGPFYRKMIEQCQRTGADLFVAHEPQSILIARKAAEGLGTKYLFDAHESVYYSNVKDRWAKRWEFPRLRYFTAANPMTREAILRLSPDAQSEVIYNASLCSPSAVSEPSEAQDCVLLHEGSLPFNRGLVLLLEGLSILVERRTDWTLRIVGRLKSEEQEYYDERVLGGPLEERISLTGWVSYESLDQALEGADVGLILNTETPNNLYGGPANKLFNYMAKGCAIVSVDLPETKRIIKDTKSGLVLPERDPGLLADILEGLIDKRSEIEAYKANCAMAKDTWSWSAEETKLLEFYRLILEEVE
jgi:glycosyltransferase involved in cell wall biosynthesis